MSAASEFVMMDPDELELRLGECRKEMFNLRFQLATGQLDNTARMGKVRKDVARILTVIRDREIQEAEGTFAPPAGGWRTTRAAVVDDDDELEVDEPEVEDDVEDAEGEEA
jgi:large subunit ribosomal protein L29